MLIIIIPLPIIHTIRKLVVLILAAIQVIITATILTVVQTATTTLVVFSVICLAVAIITRHLVPKAVVPAVPLQAAVLVHHPEAKEVLHQPEDSNYFLKALLFIAEGLLKSTTTSFTQPYNSFA
jgi:hypothetical protein